MGIIADKLRESAELGYSGNGTRSTAYDGAYGTPEFQDFISQLQKQKQEKEEYEYDYRKIPYFGDLIGSAADATANYVAGAAEFLGADDTAKYLRNEAQKGQERLAQYHGENKTPELSMDYILSPNGLTRATGSVGGSLLTSLAVGKMLTPASAVAGLTGLASKVPMVGNYAKTLASGAAQSIPATGFEAISQGGNWMLDQQEKGNMTPEQIQQGGRDVALENAGVLLGSNAIEMGLLGKYLGGLGKAIHGKRTGIKTATAIPEMAANLGLQSAEEGWQRGIDLKHEGKDYSYNPVDWFTDPKYSEQLAETKEGFAGLAPFSFLGVGGNYMSNRAVAKKYEGDEWESAFEEYKGKRMDNGKKGCVEAATKIGAKAGSPWLAKQLDGGVVDGDTLLQNAKSDGLDIIEFNPDEVERGDIILYDKNNGEENSHTVLADGLGGVWGNSSSNLRVEEYDSYNMGDNLVPARIIKTGTYDGEFADGEQGDFDTFVDKIGLNESGNNYDAVNSDSGASGKYQIMPENWGAWAEEAGLDANAEMTPENQEKVARHKLKQYYDKYGEAGALVAWYAGEANAERYANGEKTDIWGKEWTSPQGEYPSIQSYIDNTLGQNVKPKKKPARVNIDSDETVETDSKSSVPSLEEYMKMFDEGGTEQKSYSDYLAMIENASDEQVVANAKKELDNLSKNGDMENYSLFKELLDDGNVEELRNIAIEQASQGSGVVEQNDTPTETFDFFGMANQLRDMADNSTEEQREAITQALSSNAPLMMYHALDRANVQQGESLSEEETNRMNEVLNSSAMPNNVKTELSGMFNNRNYDGVRQMLGTIPDSVRPQAETNPQAQASVEDEKALWEQTQANLDRNTQSQQAQRIAQEQANRVYDNAPLSPQEVRAVNNVLNSADGVVSPAIKDELRKAFNGNDFAGVRKVISGMPDNLPTQAETNQRNMAEVQKAIDNARYNINRAMQEFEDFKNMLDPFEREFMEVLETVYGEYGRKFDSLLKSLRYYKGEAKKKIIKAQKEKNEQAVVEAQKELEGYNYAIEGLEGIAVKAREYEARRETIGRKGTSNADEQSSRDIHQKAPSREVIELVKTYGTMLKDRLIDNNVPINEQAVGNALNSENENTVNNVVERMENIADKNGVPTKDLKEQSDREQSEKELTLKDQLKAVKAEKEEILKPYLEYIEKTSGNGIEIVPSNDGSRRGLRVSKSAEWYQKWREANKSEATPNPVLRSKKQKLEVAERMYRGEIETDINSFRPKTKEEANEYKAEIQRMNTEMDTLNSVITELENQIADEKAKTEQAKAERKAQKEKNKSPKKKNTPKSAVNEQESREGVASKPQRETPSEVSENPTQGKSEGRISDNKAKKSNEKEFALNDVQIYESELKDIISDGNIKAKYTGKLVNGKPHYDITFESQGDYEKFYSAYYGESEDVDNFADNETEENDNFEIEDGLVKLSAKELKKQSDINRKEQLNMVKTEFPTAKNIKQNGDSISFKLFGHNVVVNFADHIVASEAEKEAYRRDYGEEYTDDVEILGKTETIDGTQIITLLKSGEKDTISHEAFHLAFRTVLTKEQQDMLLDKYGDEEAVAEAYRKLMGKSNARGTMFDMSSKLGRLFQKIWNFANSLFNVLSKGSLLHDAESVMYAIADGSIYDINNGKKGIEAYIHPSLLAAWHGSGAKFDEFSTDSILSGQGAISHGWGLYFALNKNVADDYRLELSRKLIEDSFEEISNTKFDGKTIQEWYEATEKEMSKLTPKDKAFNVGSDKYYMLEQTLLKAHPQEILKEARDDGRTQQAIDWYENTIAKKYPAILNGFIYEVDIPSTDTMLREDKPFSEQPKKVQTALKKLWKDYKDSNTYSLKKKGDVYELYRGDKLVETYDDEDMAQQHLEEDSMFFFGDKELGETPKYKELSEFKDGREILSYIRQNLYLFTRDENFRDDKGASLWLNMYGIEGISYDGSLDGECCVVFNDKAVKILERNGESVSDNNTKLMAFAGKRATKVAPQNSLDTAMQMEKEGKSAEEIYKSTEWFKGKDNKWKYEIPDNLDSIDLSKLKDGKSVKLGDIYDNEKLFSAYPELKDIDVIIENLEEKFYGLYTEEDNLMSLDEGYIKKEPNEIKKTILHEMQHAIQHIEGFAKGANSKFAMTEVNIEMDNVLKKLFGNKDNALGYIRKINQLKKALVNPEKNLATIKRLTHSKPLDEVKELVGRFDNLYEGIKKVAKLSSRKQNEAMYDMSAGEQESIEVERRAEENDKSMPVPHKDDAVIVFGDEEIPIRASKSAVSQDNIKLSARKKVIDKAKTTINNFLNNRNTELNERELTRRLEDLSGLKVKWGRVDSADKAILKTLEGVIRAKKRYDFESIVPLMGDAICKKLHLPTGDEAMNAYITQWLLTGESQPNTRIGMAFKKAMKQNAVYANQLIDVQLSFVQWNSLDADIRQARTIKDGTEKGTRKDKAKSFFEKIHDQFIEELGPVKRMVDEIEKVKGEKLKITLNPYIAFRMFRGHYGKAMVMVEGKTNKAVNALKTLFPSADVHWENFKTLQMIFDEVGVSTAQDIKEFAVYCAAKHFKDINVRNTENEQKINSAKAVLEKAKDKEYAKSHKDEVEKARNTLNAFKDWQPYTVPSSFTEADCDKTISKYQNNAKFVQGQKDVVNYSKTLVDICYSAGLMSEERYNQMRNSWENYVPLHRSFAENENIWGDSFKHMTGSAENITNPFETLIHNTFEFMKQAEKNKAKRLLADVASMSDLGAIIENVPEGSAMGNTIRYYVDGKIRYLEAEPQVVNAINNMGMSAVSWYAKFFKTISSVARACFTSLNPSFVIRNALRDVQDAAVYNKGLTPYDFFYGFKEAIKHGFATLGKGSDSEKYYEWLASGAAQASAVALDRNYSVATMKKITKTWDLTNISDFGSAILNYLQAFSEYSEYGTRIGVYEGTKRNVKKNNKNATNAAAILEAAYMSRDQMDFARGGKASRDWNNWAIFANASIQGWDKFYRALKENPRSVLTKISMACMCTYALSFMFDYDDEWYKELPDFQKQNFWIMKFGDTIWRIPKGQDVGLRFFTNAVDKMIGVTTRGEKANAESYFKPVQDLLPSILPTALLPAIEAMTNYSIFREAPIVPGYQQRLPEYMQYSPNSSGVAKGIASLSRFFGFETGISPRKIDHLIYGYGGSVVTGLAQLGGLLYDGAMGDGVQIDYTNITKYPILSGITAEIMKNPNSVTEFYKEYDKQNRFNAEYKQTKKKPDGYDPALYKRMDRANKLLSKYNKQEREILMDKKLTPEAKNAKLKVLSEKRVSVVKKVMKK